MGFQFRRTGQARATACASTVSHDAFLITPPSGPPSPRWRSTCAHRQCSRAPSASLAATTTHSLRTFSLSPTTRGPTMTSVPRPSSHGQILNQTLNDQILNDNAAAATPQKPELGSSKEAAKPRVAAVFSQEWQQRQNLTALADVPSFAVGS